MPQLLYSSLSQLLIGSVLYYSEIGERAEKPKSVKNNSRPPSKSGAAHTKLLLSALGMHAHGLMEDDKQVGRQWVRSHLPHAKWSKFVGQHFFLELLIAVISKQTSRWNKKPVRHCLCLIFTFPDPLGVQKGTSTTETCDMVKLSFTCQHGKATFNRGLFPASWKIDIQPALALNFGFYYRSVISVSLAGRWLCNCQVFSQWSLLLGRKRTVDVLN